MSHPRRGPSYLYLRDSEIRQAARRENCRQLDKEKADKLREESKAILDEPLNEPLSRHQKRRIKQRVERGLHPMKPWNVW